MAVVFRTDGAWGTGLGTNLTAAQIDNNFWEIIQRLVDLETQAPAVGTLTLVGNAVNNETVTTGSRVYTWKTVLTGAANEVLRGASASASLDNLIAAYNGDAGEGTTYGNGTLPNSLVTAAAGAGDTMVVTARVPGTMGNTIPLADTMTAGAWSGALMTGGVGAGADNIENIQVIGSQMTIYLQSGLALGPFTLPIAVMHWRGNWAPEEDYNELDIVFVPLIGVYLVKITHTSPAGEFDPAFTVLGSPVYHKLFAVPGVTAMNWKGEYAEGDYFANDTFLDPVSGFSWVVVLDHAAGPTFDPDLIDFDTGLNVYQPMATVEEDPAETGDFKESVKAATTENIVLSGEQTIDTVVTLSSRVLVKNQTDKKQNGIYLSAAGAWARSADADEDDEVTSGMLVFVESGSVNDGRLFTLKTANPIVLGTTNLVFSASNIAPGARPKLTITAAGNTNARMDDNHDRRFIIFNSASAQTYTIDDDTEIGVNREIWFSYQGTGGLDLVQAGAQAIVRPPGETLSTIRFGFYRLRHQATNDWLLIAPGSFHSDAILNQSAVIGATVSDALDQLAADIVSGGGLPSKVNKSGDVMTGALGINVTPITNEYLAINKAGGAAIAMIRGEGTTSWQSQRFSSDASPPTNILDKARGSIATPSALSTNDQLGAIVYRGWGTGTTFREGGRITVTAIAASPSNTDMQSKMAFTLTPAASVTPFDAFRISALGIGQGADPQAAVASTGTLTLTGNAVAAETVTIGNKTYTWRATVSTVANEVLIGATASDSLDNLIAAINAGAGSGTLYGSLTTAHTQVTAAAGAGDTMVVTAIAAGEAGNVFLTSETMTTGAWTVQSMTGGSEAFSYSFFSSGRLGGAVSTQRAVFITNSGTMTLRNSNNAAIVMMQWDNFGVTAANHGVIVDARLGALGAFGAVAGRLYFAATDTFGDTALRSAELRISVVQANVLTETLRINALSGLGIQGANYVIDAARSFVLRSYTIAGSPVASANTNKMVAQSDAPGGAAQAFSDGTSWLNPIYRNRTTNVTVGYTSTEFDLGTVTTGTTTPNPANGQIQKMVNGGASTLAAPSATGSYPLTVQVTNNASAGTLTLTGVTKQDGATLDNVNGHVWNLYYTKIGSNVHLNIVAMF